MESEPLDFFRGLEQRADHARSVLGDFVGADPDDLAFVPNATTGVNTVLQSLSFDAGDEILVTDHEYNACRNAAVAAVTRSGARVITAQVPFPLDSPQQVVDSILTCVSSRTRLLLVDHVTSPTGLIFPIGQLVDEMTERGIDTLVDGAHAPGMISLDIEAVGAAYYTANAHKWMCAPKGAAFLHVRRDRQSAIVPTVISHGANSPRIDRSRFRLLFDWTGTNDPTPYLSIPAALQTMGSLHPDGWPGLMRNNHVLALRARDTITTALSIPAPAPNEMIGSMAAVPIGPASGDRPVDQRPALQRYLRDHHHIEVPISIWPDWPDQVLRISAQVYNRAEQYDALARVLTQK